MENTALSERLLDRGEQDREIILKVTGLNRTIAERPTPAPVGGFKSMRDVRLEKEKEARIRAAGDPRDKGWNLDNEIRDVQRRSEDKDLDTGT